MAPSRESKLLRRLAAHVGRAIDDFALIEPGDRILVAMSGGKDSYALAHLLQRLQRRSPKWFTLVAVHLDQGHPGYDGTPLEAWLGEHAFEHRILHRNTYAVVIDKIEAGKTYCSLCSRLRRGILYSAAQEMGCNKIALGHHRDDSLETLFLNLIFTGQLKAMPPKLVSDDGKNVVIRPLMYCAEDELRAFAEEQRFPILPCNLCGSQDNLMRQEVKRLLGGLEARFPGSQNIMLSALRNVRASHLLDTALWKQAGLAVARDPLERWSPDERPLDPPADGVP
ncbi:MAG TPA: tRNA 2-thiocytidine(32) synthetase TtcA [Myxococcota bacterium]|jgi:tRNA 2-thiocytidine biosynthesis protein TtcA|nr:tRNA 2-thiocytidine(32) synthetase TtcA [Myxococcota bacterium]